MSVNDSIKLTILKYNYWETYKHAKDAAQSLPLGHHRRIEIESSLNEILVEMNNLDAKIKKRNNEK